MAAEWFPDWSSDICAVVASGESATEENVALLRDRCRVLVINNGFQRALWADVLYGADGRWWDTYKDARHFAGLKITAEPAAAKRYRINLIALVAETDAAAHVLCTEAPGTLGRGGNGGFQALNLAVQFGAKRIVLVGFDLCGEHWHDKHPEPLKNPRARTLDKWRRRFDMQAPLLASLGIEVANASDRSALTAYPIMDITTALVRWKA